MRIGIQQQSDDGIRKATAADYRLDPQWCTASASWRQRRRFIDTARKLIKFPAAGDDPVGHLLTEVQWRQLVPPDDQEEVVITALSQATGIYFFPSREWVLAFCRLVYLLGMKRVLEAGAGRGYTAAVLAPLLARQGIAFKAVDNAQGEFESGLPRHPIVEQAEALAALRDFSADLVLYSWPPPGQSIASLCRSAGVRYIIIVGEPCGGCTGDPTDWQRFSSRTSAALSSLGLGRSGRRQQTASTFFGSAHPRFREMPVTNGQG